jgi:hypothetical protein
MTFEDTEVAVEAELLPDPPQALSTNRPMITKGRLQANALFRRSIRILLYISEIRVCTIKKKDVL